MWPLDRNPGGVIASSDKAAQDNLNKLTTGTLTHSDIENHASYDASSIGLSGGYGGTIGKDQMCVDADLTSRVVEPIRPQGLHLRMCPSGVLIR